MTKIGKKRLSYREVSRRLPNTKKVPQPIPSDLPHDIVPEAPIAHWLGSVIASLFRPSKRHGSLRS